jgi:hypothetical protein
MSGEGTLIISLAEEVAVDERGEEGILEGDCTQNHAHEDQDLGVGDDGHGAVIVGYRSNVSVEQSSMHKEWTHP